MAENSRKPTLPDYAFCHNLRVRWPEVDSQKIVYNPIYFVYFDIAATEYVRAVDFTYPAAFEELGMDLFAVNASANFRKSAGFDDELKIGCRVADIGRTSLRFDLAVFRDIELLVDGSLTWVNATKEGGVPTPLPRALIDRIIDFELIAPTRK